MQDNIENTKEIGLDDLVPEGQKKPVKKTSSAKTTSGSKKKNASKKRKSAKKFKPIYLVPIIFIVIVGLVIFSVWKASKQDGPVYGERCQGMTEITSTVLNETVNEIKENSDVKDLVISVNCKTVKIDLTMSEGVDWDVATEVCENILLTLDGKVGLSQSNSESKYSDLFGTLNGKTQYHVDFTIKGDTDEFPIFGSKHPSSDKINFTYNSARDPELVEKLYEQQAEDDTGDNTEE